MFQPHKFSLTTTTDLLAQTEDRIDLRSLRNRNCSLTAPLTEIIDRKALEHAGRVSNEEGALVVRDGDDQGAAEADHEVRHGEAEDENVHGLEEGRVPQHHGYDEAVVEDRQQRVDEHKEGDDAVAHPGEDGGRCSHQCLGVDGRRMRAGAPRRAVAVHGAKMKSSFGDRPETVCSARDTASSSLSFVIPHRTTPLLLFSQDVRLCTCLMEKAPNAIWEIAP